jgi:hypothetical protein
MCKHLPTALLHVVEALEPNIGIRETFGARQPGTQNRTRKITPQKSLENVQTGGINV